MGKRFATFIGHLINVPSSEMIMLRLLHGMPLDECRMVNET